MLWAIFEFNTEGQPARLFGVIQDITERKRVEEALIEKSKIFEAFFQNTVAPLVFLDKYFNFIMVNEAYAKACQREISEFLGHNHFEFFPSDARAIFERVVETKELFQTIARPFIFPDHPEWGVTCWDWTLTPILDKKGEVQYLAFSLNDVTMRKRAEEDLRTSEARLRVGLNTAKIAVFNQDLDLRYIWMYQPQLGYTSEQVTGHTDAELLPPEAARQVTEIKRRVLESGLKEHAEVPVGVGGQTFVYDLVVEPLRDANSAIIGLTGASLDITERKQAEAALRESERRFREMLENVELIAVILDVEGRVAFCNDHLLRVTEPRQFQTRTGINCELVARTEALDFDRERSTAVFRIFQEILTNVIRHAQASKVDVQLSKRDGYVELCVKDNGRGITEEEMRNPRSLGLLGMRERALLVGGEVSISGVAGKGTTVVVRVPVQ